MKWLFNKRKANMSSLLLFSLAFLLIATLVIAYLISNHLTFVRNGDAYTQHYPTFLYMGEWYRTALGGLLTGKGLPSIWDFSIGYGLDAGQTLFFYGFFDWVSIVFSFFANSNNGYWFYTIMMLFQAYLAGIAFVLFCQKHNCSKTGSAIAALAYITCPYMLENVFNGHPNFANPLMYLPLILIGIEDIIRGKNSVRYIITVSLSILSSLYYFYMEMVFAVVYFLCRSVYINSENKLWSVLRSGLIISCHTISGILISMPIILPIISGLISDKRTTTHIPIPALYSMEEYREAIKSLITSNSFNYYGHLGVSACILVGVILLFSCKNKNSGWIRILWIIISLISCLIPYLGYLMNGRTYIANRHVWIYIMITCFSFAFQFDNMFDLQKKSACLTILIISLFIISLCLIDNSVKTSFTRAIGPPEKDMHSKQTSERRKL